MDLCAIVCKFVFEGKKLKKSLKSVFKFYILFCIVSFITTMMSPMLNNLFFYGKLIGNHIQEIELIKTKSVWIVVILHCLNNNMSPLLMRYTAEQNEKAYSWLGILVGIISLALISLPLLKAKEWRENTDRSA